ncbi:hypothetical protein [Aquimarina aquimarini]|uniref:hypothetical protein n=1 Tax=Aquimarina aquimarini TaxID=1191734 RepID=UPI000D559568|nr:hypothetical protein [Aquimarina aquimarini]
MKIKYLLYVLILLISCTQNTKEKKEPVVKVEDAIRKSIDAQKKSDAVSFDEISTDIIKTPRIDITKFDNVIEQLNIEKTKINTDLLVTKIMSDNPDETIMVIPEYANKDIDLFELNSYIVIVNSNTGKITHKYFESYKTNGWISDAIRLDEIKIDTASYFVDNHTRAFGIRVHYFGSSRANPYYNQTLSLFIKEGDTLKKVLHNFSVEENTGEYDGACSGQFLAEAKILIMAKEKTNGYFDIVVKNKITKTKKYQDENGDCDSKEKIITKTSVLKFNSKEYKKNTCTFSSLDVYINDADPNGTNIRGEPNGKIILNLNNQSEYFILTITEANNGWFKVLNIKDLEYKKIKIPGDTGWVHNSVIEASTSKKVTLVDTIESNTTTGVIDVETQVRIKDKCADWVKIEYKDLNGWIESKWLCGNPVTTCP